MGTIGDISLSPALSHNEMQIVLTWEATPSDLDARMATPFNCEVAYWHKVCATGGPLGPRSELDADRSGGYGPETITTYEWAPGLYNYSVHAFATASGFSGQAQAARVQVWTEDGLIATYSPPSTRGCSTCSWWRVMQIDGTSRRLITVNQLAMTERDSVEDEMPPK